MESIVREKVWIAKTLLSLYKDGEHNVMRREKIMDEKSLGFKNND